MLWYKHLWFEKSIESIYTKQTNYMFKHWGLTYLTICIFTVINYMYTVINYHKQPYCYKLPLEW